jgi:DNA polymerase-3 subunit delta'
MGNWPVVGHEWALELLADALKQGRLSHAYLFTGPAQVGKTTVARAFAQALLCEREAGTPCGECRTCQRVAAGRHPDVQLIRAQRDTIQIEQVRMLQSDAALSPLEGRYRVFIIREIEKATPPAANALLKTLEEPPPRVILLLTSARPDQLLPTVVSRCQVIGLRPLPLEIIRTALETRWGVDPERAALLARLSAGRLGWAVEAQSNPELWEARSRALDDLLALTGDGPYGRLAYAEALSRRAEALDVILGLWASWWHDVLLIQRGLPDALVNLDRRVQLAQQAELYQPHQVVAALEDLVQTVRWLKANVNVRLALDVLLLRLPRPAVP